MASSLDRLTPRDRTILRRMNADKIESLMPLTRMGIAWRQAFEAAIVAETVKMNGVSRYSDAFKEHAGWGIAHQFVLDEVSGG